MRNLISIVTLIILAFVLIVLSSAPTELTFDMAERLEAENVEFAYANNLVAAEYPTTNTPSETIIKWGNFVQKRMPINGRAVIYRNLNDLYITLEVFETNQYPDLKLYLIPAEDANVPSDVMAAFYEVGVVQPEGEQMFDLPDDLDLERYKSAVIFSERQNILYGIATLR